MATKKKKESHLNPRWRRLRPCAWRFSHGGGQVYRSRFAPESACQFTTTEVLVKLRKPPLHILGNESSNVFRFRLGPGEISLSLSALVKRPGEELVSKPAHLSIVEEPTADEVDAYERLLEDAMHGDGMLFVREDAVEAAWAIVDPVLANERSLAPIRARLVGTS
jgi:glucose-6-phosphate 1-dehydrogenase